jgi:hypothetical protein
LSKNLLFSQRRLRICKFAETGIQELAFEKMQPLLADP